MSCSTQSALVIKKKTYIQNLLKKNQMSCNAQSALVCKTTPTFKICLKKQNKAKNKKPKCLVTLGVL